tara:strand:+ start:181 stop:438 length:258 start_codon:yes stop_codon:yes gene_type:complete
MGNFKSVAFPIFVEMAPVDHAANKKLEVMLGIKLTESAADTLGIGPKVEIVPVREEVFPPRLIDRDLGVQNKTIEVKNKRFGHGL